MAQNHNAALHAAARHCRHIANGAFSEVSENVTRENSAAKKLAKELSACLKKIHNLYPPSTHSNPPSLSQSERWILDNLYILNTETALCVKALSHTKKVLSHNGKPLVFNAARLYASRLGETLSDTSCTAFAQAFPESFPDITSRDMYSLCVFIKAALLSLVFEAALPRTTQKDKSTMPTDDASRAEFIGKCFGSLKYLSYHNFEKSFCATPTEKLLNADPASVYPIMDETTKAFYRRQIENLAQKRGVSEKEIAAHALELANNAAANQSASLREKHIGLYLCPPPRGGTLYMWLLLSLTAAATLALCLASPLCLLLLFPFWETVKTILDYAFSKAARPSPIPGIDPEKLSGKAGVLVVITSLLGGEKRDKELFDKLERIYLSSNPSYKNSIFGLLGDLPDSPGASSSADRSTIDYATDRINALNRKYGDKFALFIRERRYSKSEKSFMGWERKRGAVIELVRFLKGKKTTFSTCPERTSNRDIKYVVTLDSDTNIPIGSLARLVGAMEHPLNRPVIDPQKGIVTQGYGIMQPPTVPEISCAGKTPFSRVMCGEGGSGIDIYSGARFDLYQTLFGEGIFCGKGIFDVNAFYETIDRPNPFPEDFILSHDSTESARLRCAIITDVTFTDSFPKNSLSYLKRSHRWIRGDIQNLAFLLSHPRFAGGASFTNPISPLSRFKLFDNARRALVPVMSFLALVICSLVCAFSAFSGSGPLFSKSFSHAFSAVISASATPATANALFPPGGAAGIYALFCAALAPWLVPAILDALNCLVELNHGGIGRRFYSRGVCAGLWQSFLRFLYFVCMLPKTASVSAGAVFTSLRRMLITGSGLIEWQTAAQSDLGDGSLLDFIRKNLVCAISGAAVFIFCPVGILRLVAFGWFLFPAIAYFSSFDYESRKKPCLSENEITDYAKSIWDFFDTRVNQAENFLPPDNVSFFPAEKTAHRTSPTNIGLYLTALLCAADFGFINADTLCNRLDKTLCVIEKLPKVKGHLFNWYSTDTLCVLNPRFVSTVDSGNFLSCLIVLKEGLREFVAQKPELAGIITRTEKLIFETDLSVLYNTSRNLFSMGLSHISHDMAQSAKAAGKPLVSFSSDGEETQYYIREDGCYDLFMSEARTTSYIAIARGEVPVRHWTKTSRPLISEDGYMGLSSWTGTAFEYFMPCLFLPTFSHSLNYEALCFAYKCQRKRRGFFKSDTCGIFGISESGFFGFDADMNYGYKAFGIPSLGLKRDLKNDLVISPYSSFLFLALDRKQFPRCNTAPIAKNLKAMQAHGLYGRYGFYEAIDFTPSRIGQVSAENAAPNTFRHEPCLVKSFMSHHLGMSLAALCNARFDDLLCKRFMADPSMASAKELLEEKIPVGAIAAKPSVGKQSDGVKPPRQSFRAESDGKIITPNPSNPRCTMLYSGTTRLLCSSCGTLKASIFDNLIFDYNDNFTCAPRGLCTLFHINGKILCPSLFPQIPPHNSTDTLPPPPQHFFKYSNGDVSYITTFPGGSAQSSFTLSGGLVRAKLTVTLSSAKNRVQNVRGSLFGIPVLESENHHFAHPAFSFLSIEAAFDNNEKILTFSRRPRHETSSNPCAFLSAALLNPSHTLDFDTRIHDVFEKNQAFANNFANYPFSGKQNVGACISPAMALYFDMPYNPKSGAYEQEIVMSVGASQKEAHAGIVSTRNNQQPDFHKAQNACACVAKRLKAASGALSERANEFFEAMLCATLYGKSRGVSPDSQNAAPPSLPLPRDSLWKNGISGDLPIISIHLASESLLYACREIVRAYRLLLFMDCPADLCFVYTDTNSYSTPTKNALLAELSALGVLGCVNRKNGGIFLINEPLTDDISAEAVLCASRLIFEANSSRPRILHPCAPQITPPPPHLLPTPQNHHRPHREAPPPADEKIRVNGGHFLEDNSFCVKKSDGISLPYSHILAGKNLSCLVTQNSLGFTFAGNSSEKRLTPWTSLPDSPCGERIFAFINGIPTDLCQIAHTATYRPGLCVYQGKLSDFSFEINVYVCEKLRCKAMDVSLTPLSSTPGQHLRLCYFVTPTMGKSREDSKNVVFSGHPDRVEFQSLFSNAMNNLRGFICAFSPDSASLAPLSTTTSQNAVFSASLAADNSHPTHAESNNCAAISAGLSFAGNAPQTVRFVLGAYKSPSELDLMYQSLRDGYTEKQRAANFAKSLIPPLSLEFSNTSPAPLPRRPEAEGQSVLFNLWLPYQNAACRFFARCGYYQAGGAYGFRDQLQDCLCLVHSRPEIVRSHLLRCASRQFEQGDVLHWWHEQKDGSSPCKGVRSRCSDDYLWLVYVTAKYVRHTGDTEILHVKIPYLSAPQLTPSQSEAYISPTLSNTRESLFHHLKRAVDRAMQLIGTHGLPLIGSCDWSDGLNGVGKDGKGESVWLALFLNLVTNEFVTLCKLCKFNHSIYESFGTGLIENVNRNAVDPGGKYLVRGFYDNGSPLGASSCDECKIDFLPQCFYALCADKEVTHTTQSSSSFGKASPELCFSALKSGYDLLFNPTHRLTALFTPPFSKTPLSPGYIKGYVAGIRENGGQYTHAAVWAAKGMFRAAKNTSDPQKAKQLMKMGGEIFLSINPILRTSGFFGTQIASHYKTEPYALCGDVYTNPEHIGRGGWSWYSGAAGWYYTTMLNDIFGIEFEALFTSAPKIKLSLSPMPLAEIFSGAATLCAEPLKGCICNFRFEKGSSPSVTVDGRPCNAPISKENCAVIPIVPGNHTICITRRQL